MGFKIKYVAQQQHSVVNYFTASLVPCVTGMIRLIDAYRPNN